jgi:hypothetical protein
MMKILFDNIIFEDQSISLEIAANNDPILIDTILPDGQCNLSANYGPIVCIFLQKTTTVYRCDVLFFHIIITFYIIITFSDILWIQSL